MEATSFNSPRMASSRICTRNAAENSTSDMASKAVYALLFVVVIVLTVTMPKHFFFAFFRSTSNVKRELGYLSTKQDRDLDVIKTKF